MVAVTVAHAYEPKHCDTVCACLLCSAVQSLIGRQRSVRGLILKIRNRVRSKIFQNVNPMYVIVGAYTK